MSKYDSLPILLDQKQSDSVRLSFREIEDFLGFSMPASKTNRAWWSNNPDNSVMTKVWLNAGWRTRDVDIDGEQVTFVRNSALNSALVDLGGDEEDGRWANLDDLNEIAASVLRVLARRSRRSLASEAIEVLNDSLSA